MIPIAAAFFIASALEAAGSPSAGAILAREPQELSSRAVYHYTVARLMEMQGDPKGALDEMKLAVTHDAGSAFLHLALAGMFLRLNMIPSAIAQAEEGARLNPKSSDGYLQLAEILEHAGDFTSAEEALKRGIAAEPGKMEPYIEMGRLLLYRQRFKEAEAVFEMMMANFPGDSRGFFAAGRLYFEKRMLQKSEVFLAKAMEKDPANVNAGVLLASVLELQRKFVEARAVLESLMHYVSDDPEIILALGRLSLSAGDKAAAARYFDHLKRSGGDEAEARATVAVTYLQNGDTAEAKAEIEKADRLFPENESIALERGLILEETGDWAQALKVFESFKWNSRAAPRVIAHRAYCLQKLKRPSDALALARPAIASMREPDGLLLQAAAESWADQKRWDEGSSALRGLISRRPQWAEPVEALALLEERRGDPDKALKVLDRAISGESLGMEDRLRIMLYKALVLEKAGRSEEALAAAREVLEKSPDNPEALNFVGYSLAEAGRDLGAAEEMVTRALLYKPNSGYVLDSLGWVFYAQGRYEEALTVMRRADRLAPNEPEIMDHLAAVLIKLGKTGEALEILQKALKLDPEPKVKERIQKRIGELMAAA